MTNQRQVILDILRASREHPTANRIYELARKRMPNIAMGTVYRNLGQLTASGEVRRLPMPDGADRYDGNVSRHEHMTCTACGRLLDIFSLDLTEYIERSAGVRVSGYELAVEGVCAECLSKERSEQPDEQQGFVQA